MSNNTLKKCAGFCSIQMCTLVPHELIDITLTQFVFFHPTWFVHVFSKPRIKPKTKLVIVTVPI